MNEFYSKQRAWMLYYEIPKPQIYLLLTLPSEIKDILEFKISLVTRISSTIQIEASKNEKTLLFILS